MTDIKDENLERRISFLRQWLNEDRIKEGERFVTNQDIHDWLDEGIEAYAAKRVDELLDTVDRFEVIDDTGRAYVKGSIYGNPVKVELSLQDDGRTLKAFVSKREVHHD